MTISASIPPSVVRIPCGIAVPEIWVGRARYALEALLLPLGLEPVWVEATHVAPYSSSNPAPQGSAGGTSTAPSPGAETADASVGIWYADAGTPGPQGWVHVVSLVEKDAQDLLGTFPDPVLLAYRWLSGDLERGQGRDRFGRIGHAGSVHERLGVGSSAPVDEAREGLARSLREAGVRLYPRRWAGRAWALCPTHDVDYVRRARPGILWREGVHYLLGNDRGVSPGDRWARFGRFLSDAWPGRDPFLSAIDRMQGEEDQRGATATWFFKTGAHGPHDVPYRIGARAVRSRVERLLSAGHEIGLHPAFHTYAHADRLMTESDRLAQVTGRRPTALRTHYLRWNDPVSPRSAIDAGFSVDSTLGFPDAAGFRRGTCLPFRLWDPVAERPLDIWEMSLCVMESALFNRLGLGVEAALAETERLARTCRRHGGALVALWHNTLWEEDDYPGWGDHFLATLSAASDDGAAIRSLSSALGAWQPSE